MAATAEGRRGVATVALALVASFAALGASHAAIIVVPGAQEAVAGNSNNVGPFGDPDPSRVQQVFSGSEFGGLRVPFLITDIAFRLDALPLGTTFSATIGNIELDLSTTMAVPDGLSTAFAANLGSDNTTVFSGSLDLSGTSAGPAIGPRNFGPDIHLQTPFLYNPQHGNLLLDVRNFSGTVVSAPCCPTLSSLVYDGERTSGDSVSRVFIFGDANASTGFADTIGLVARFTVVPVPEPSSLLLIVAALVSLRKRLRPR